MAQTWTLREIARVSGRPLGHVTQMARDGLLPGYKSTPRRPAKVPNDVAEAFIAVLRSGLSSPRLAQLMKEDPQGVLRLAEDLASVARRALAETETEEAA